MFGVKTEIPGTTCISEIVIFNWSFIFIWWQQLVRNYKCFQWIGKHTSSESVNVAGTAKDIDKQPSTIVKRLLQTPKTVNATVDCLGSKKVPIKSSSPFCLTTICEMELLLVNICKADTLPIESHKWLVFIWINPASGMAKMINVEHRKAGSNC